MILKKIKLLCFFVVNFCYVAEQRVSQLFSAIKRGELEEVTKLLNDNMIDINNVTDQAGRTPFMVASQSTSLRYQMVKLLLDKGTDVNKGVANWTALMQAIENNDKKMVKLLLDHRADVYSHNKDGRPALMQASFYCRKEIVELLLDYGVDINSSNNFTIPSYKYYCSHIRKILEIYRYEYLPYKENRIKEILATRKKLPEIIKSFPNVLFSTLNEYIDDHDYYLKFSEFLKYKNKADKKRKSKEFDSTQGSHKKSKN